MFGPGCERDFVVLRPANGRMEAIERWAWYSEFNNLRIYFRGEEEFTFFNLKWQ
jgi:hypothetical protein